MILKTDYSKVLGNTQLAHRRAVDDVEGEARMNAGVSVSRGAKLNVGDVQGGFRASITHEHTGPLSSRVGTPHRGGMMREKGGTIVPVRARMLSWVDPVTGKRVFARRVHQLPGFIRGRRGRSAWLKPAGDLYPKFMEEHLKALG